MEASWDDCGGGLRFDIADRACALRPAFEGLGMGAVVARSHGRDCRTSLLLGTRSIEQGTLKKTWISDQRYNQNSQAMARLSLKNGSFRCRPFASLTVMQRYVRSWVLSGSGRRGK
jgi:hypothetical protein